MRKNTGQKRCRAYCVLLRKMRINVKTHEKTSAILCVKTQVKRGAAHIVFYYARCDHTVKTHTKTTTGCAHTVFYHAKGPAAMRPVAHLPRETSVFDPHKAFCTDKTHKKTEQNGRAGLCVKTQVKRGAAHTVFYHARCEYPAKMQSKSLRTQF